MLDLQERLDLIKQVLGEDLVELTIVRLKIDDNLSGFCSAEVTLSPELVVTGTGVGQVAAIFSALKAHFAQEYRSLSALELVDLTVRLKQNTGRRRDGADAECSATIAIRNSRGGLLDFSCVSRSLGAATARSVTMAVEFFINSERAFCALRKALGDAQRRDRQDLVSRYTAQLSSITAHTSYGEVKQEK